ncbi:MAG TPA: hypothetical protein VGL11_01200 [Candidatus Binatia bacterium]|jgi:hypothetical protein
MNYGTRLTIEDKVASLFQLDPVLPAQYLETFQRKAYLPPEKELMLAVLEDAVACFQGYARARNVKSKRLFVDAAEWIQEKNTEWLFSFEHICEWLGFDPSYVRAGLIKGKEMPLTRSGNAEHRPTGGTTKGRRKRKKIRLAA